jgi:hypothetical protein
MEPSGFRPYQRQAYDGAMAGRSRFLAAQEKALAQGD